MFLLDLTPCGADFLIPSVHEVIRDGRYGRVQVRGGDVESSVSILFFKKESPEAKS